MLIFTLMLFVLLVMTLLFLVLTSIPYAVAMSTSLFSTGEVSKITIAAAHKIDVVGQS